MQSTACSPKDQTDEYSVKHLIKIDFSNAISHVTPQLGIHTHPPLKPSLLCGKIIVKLEIHPTYIKNIDAILNNR